MQVFAYCYAVLAVSSIYCIWHASLRHQFRRERVLRERVAFLLWEAAGQYLALQSVLVRAPSGLDASGTSCTKR
jgi:hypothetical protein